MLLFVRQMFTLRYVSIYFVANSTSFRTLRQTPLKYFIITMASTVSAVVASILLLGKGRSKYNNIIISNLEDISYFFDPD